MRMSSTVVIVGSLGIVLGVIFVTVFVPAGFIWHPEQTIVAHPMTAEEYRGYTLYYQNQCWVCHSQYSRYWDNSGWPKAQAGDYEFNMPLVLGSERTGPDLSFIGRKRSLAWELEHLKRPRVFSPNSIMPNFYWMPDRDLHDISTYLFNLGDRVAGEQMIQPPPAYTNLQDPLLLPEVPPQSTQPVPTGWDDWMAAGLQEGKELYIARCFTCHGCAGNGLGHYAAKLFTTPRNFKAFPINSMTDSEWFWHESEGIPGTVMPVWKMSDLTDLQRWSIVRYIQTVFARPVARDPKEGNPRGIYVGLQNPLPLTVPVLEEGKAIFLRECMICHNDTGTGAGAYSDGLQPPPPNFHDPSQYNDFTDADYVWRLYEGVPWTAMPSWKIQYSEADLWKLVHYIRVFFTQTEPRPPDSYAQVYPEIYLTQEPPVAGITYETARATFEQHCAKCHGLSGQGNGWLGSYLNPPPANFTTNHFKTNTPGTLFAKVSLGVQNSAMPVWNEFLFEGQRWAAVEYLIQTFISTAPVGPTGSQFNGQVAANFATVSASEWMSEDNTISATRGQEIYRTFCADCHGPVGQGDTIANTAIGTIPAFPAGMSPEYIFWRTWEGVPHTSMYAFRLLEEFSEADAWDVSAYVASLIGVSLEGGGQ